MFPFKLLYIWEYSASKFEIGEGNEENICNVTLQRSKSPLKEQDKAKRDSRQRDKKREKK